MMKHFQFIRAGHVSRAVLVVIGVVAVAAVVMQRSAADHGLPHPTLLARGEFIDHVTAHIRVKPDGQPAHVMNVHDASEIVVLEILIEPGAIAPWHAHWGPGLLINAGPGTLTTVSSHDCVLQELPPSTAVVDRGGDVLHAAKNESNDDVVLYVTFLGVPPGEPPVIPADPPEDCDPF